MVWLCSETARADKDVKSGSSAYTVKWLEGFNIPGTNASISDLLISASYGNCRSIGSSAQSRTWRGTFQGWGSQTQKSPKNNYFIRNRPITTTTSPELQQLQFKVVPIKIFKNEK